MFSGFFRKPPGFTEFPRVSLAEIVWARDPLGFILEIASLVALTDASPTSMDLSDNTYEAVKRAGFVGMRGKKSDAEEDANALSELMSSHQVWEPAFSNHKRAGFVGMRGKKAYGT